MGIRRDERDEKSGEMGKDDRGPTTEDGELLGTKN